MPRLLPAFAFSREVIMTYGQRPLRRISLILSIFTLPGVRLARISANSVSQILPWQHTPISITSRIMWTPKAFRETGVALAQRFGVLFYPTVIIVSPTGEVLEKLTGYQSGSNLLKVLKKYEYDKPSSNANSSSNTSGSSGSITDTQAALTRNLLATSPSSPAVINLMPPPAPTTSPSTASHGLFRLAVSREASSGFGYQLGVFSDYANVLKEAEALRAKNQQHVLVYISELNGTTVFKLILGPFTTRDAAARQRQATGREGMIVALGSLR